MDNETLSEVNKNLNLILKQFYELHERVEELEKTRSKIDNTMVQYAMALLVIVTIGTLWLVM